MSSNDRAGGVGGAGGRTRTTCSWLFINKHNGRLTLTGRSWSRSQLTINMSRLTPQTSDLTPLSSSHKTSHNTPFIPHLVTQHTSSPISTHTISTLASPYWPTDTPLWFTSRCELLGGMQLTSFILSHTIVALPTLPAYWHY